MRRLTISILLCLGVGVMAQSAKPQQFRWDWRKAQELDSNQAISKSQILSEKEKRKLLRAIAQQMNWVAESGGDPAALAAKARVKFVDLNGDGTPEVIAQPIGFEAGCGATGNCPFWVFEKTRAGYRLILGAEGFQVFTVEPTLTNGFRDIVLGSHDSADERTLIVFRYFEGRYRERECYNASWWTWNGGFHKLREPKVVPCAK